MEFGGEDTGGPLVADSGENNYLSSAADPNEKGYLGVHPSLKESYRTLKEDLMTEEEMDAVQYYHPDQ